MSELTHLDPDGRARMVDVSHKAATSREAVAEGRLRTTADVVALVRAEGLPKADVLPTARIAAIGAAKHTWEFIPLCHQIPLSGVSVAFELEESAIRIEVSARTTAPTGVEMEALTAVAVAGLTLHDMVKAVDPAATLGDVRLLSKTGGKSGDWSRATGAPLSGPDRTGSAGPGAAAAVHEDAEPAASAGRTATVLVASTTGAGGARVDTTGPVIAGWLRARDFEVTGPVVVADDEVAAALQEHVSSGPAVLITTGGTGISPSDVTPEATRSILTQELPGIAEEIRRRGVGATATAVMSRALAGLAGRTLVVNLPGSPGGVRDGLAVLDDLLEHVLEQVQGMSGHEPGDHRAG